MDFPSEGVKVTQHDNRKFEHSNPTSYLNTLSYIEDHMNIQNQIFPFRICFSYSAARGHECSNWWPTWLPWALRAGAHV